MLTPWGGAPHILCSDPRASVHLCGRNEWRIAEWGNERVRHEDAGSGGGMWLAEFGVGVSRGSGGRGVAEERQLGGLRTPCLSGSCEDALWCQGEVAWLGFDPWLVLSLRERLWSSQFPPLPLLWEPPAPVPPPAHRRRPLHQLTEGAGRGGSAAVVLVAQSCPTLCIAMDCSPPGSSVHWIPQASILEWVAICFSRGSSRPRNRTQVSCTAGRFFTTWATRQAGHCATVLTDLGAAIKQLLRRRNSCISLLTGKVASKRSYPQGPPFVHSINICGASTRYQTVWIVDGTHNMPLCEMEETQRDRLGCVLSESCYNTREGC